MPGARPCGVIRQGFAEVEEDRDTPMMVAQGLYRIYGSERHWSCTGFWITTATVALQQRKDQRMTEGIAISPELY